MTRVAAYGGPNDRPGTCDACGAEVPAGQGFEHYKEDEAEPVPGGLYCKKCQGIAGPHTSPQTQCYECGEVTYVGEDHACPGMQKYLDELNKDRGKYNQPPLGWNDIYHRGRRSMSQMKTPHKLDRDAFADNHLLKRLAKLVKDGQEGYRPCEECGHSIPAGAIHMGCWQCGEQGFHGQPHGAVCPGCGSDDVGASPASAPIKTDEQAYEEWETNQKQQESFEGQAQGQAQSSQEEKWQRLLSGEQVVASDDDLDYFEQRDESGQLASIPNPRQVGTRDRWVAFLKPRADQLDLFQARKQAQQEVIHRVVWFFHPGETKPVSEITAELAITPRKRAEGLSKHKDLHQAAGMLFVNPEGPKERSETFWMSTVPFPIDILYLQANQRIGMIVHNAQPGSKENWTYPKTAAVVEVVGGYCKARGIKVGDLVRIGLGQRTAQGAPVGVCPVCGAGKEETQGWGAMHNEECSEIASQRLVDPWQQTPCPNCGELVQAGIDYCSSCRKRIPEDRAAQWQPGQKVEPISDEQFINSLGDEGLPQSYLDSKREYEEWKKKHLKPLDEQDRESAQEPNIPPQERDAPGKLFGQPCPQCKTTAWDPEVGFCPSCGYDDEGSKESMCGPKHGFDPHSSREVDPDGKVVCPRCKGTGQMEPCDRCNGSGCMACRFKGAEPCPRCFGYARVDASRQAQGAACSVCSKPLGPEDKDWMGAPLMGPSGEICNECAMDLPDDGFDEEAAGPMSPVPSGKPVQTQPAGPKGPGAGPKLTAAYQDFEPMDPEEFAALRDKSCGFCGKPSSELMLIRHDSDGWDSVSWVPICRACMEPNGDDFDPPRQAQMMNPPSACAKCGQDASEGYEFPGQGLLCPNCSDDYVSSQGGMEQQSQAQGCQHGEGPCPFAGSEGCCHQNEDPNTGLCVDCFGPEQTGMPQQSADFGQSKNPWPEDRPGKYPRDRTDPTPGLGGCPQCRSTSWDPELGMCLECGYDDQEKEAQGMGSSHDQLRSLTEASQVRGIVDPSD